jgi:PAS domain S-box-containing protein
MLNTFLVLVGTVIMSYSIFRLFKIIKISEISINKEWYFLLLILIFFDIGYVLFIFFESNENILSINILNLIVSLVFFFGAVFVLTVINSFIRVLTNISDKNQKLGELNKDLKELYASLEQKVKERTVEINSKIVLIEKQNQALEKNKSAMLNLLEDSKRLEDELKIEKEEEKNRLVVVQNLYDQLKSKVTEINEQRAKLKEEKDRITAIVASMGEGLFVLDENHKIEFMNPVAEKLLGIKAKEAVGKDWSEIVTTYEGDREIPYTERSTVSSLKVGKVILTNLEDNHYYVTKTGKRFPVTSTTTPLVKNGNVMGAIKVFRDATSDKLSKEHVEQEVVKRTAELSSSIESLSLGFIMANVKGEISLFNNSAKNILSTKIGYPTIAKLAEMLIMNTPLKDLVKKAHLENRLIEIDEIDYNGRILHIYVSPIIATIEGKADDIGTVILLDDITEEKNIDRSKDEFFSIASHELRTPLTAIRGNTSMIQTIYADKIPDKEFGEMIADIHESSVRLIGIVNDFLNVSRLEMGRMEFKFETIDLVKLAKEVVQELEVSVLDKKIQVSVSPFEGKLPQVQADPNKLKEVLINLLGNSLKFTDTGSVNISFEADSQNVKTFIIDTGGGIPLESQKLLFHKFQQASNNILSKDTTRGTGLGLYISRLIIEGMKGTISLVKSEIGKGSTFMFALPVATKQ